MALATRQHGVVSIDQLLALGFSPSGVRMRIKVGRVHRLYRGVYSVGRSDVPVNGKRLAAVRACGRGALLSHASAGALLGLRRSDATLMDVTVPRRSSIRRAGIRIHRSTTLINEDKTAVDAVPCTSWARTLLDLAPLIDERALEKAIERAEILELYDHRAIQRLLERAQGQPGTRRLSSVLGIARPGQTVTASDLEEKMLALCRRCGHPDPMVNHEMFLGGERMRVDFFWPAQRVVVETDSFKYHRTRAAFRRDRRRDRLLELAGYRHARFADQEFDEDITGIERSLSALLGRR